MKITIFWVSILFLSASLSMAASSDSSGGNWFVQANGSAGLSAQKLYDSAPVGFGGEGSVGYRFGDSFAMALESGYETFIVKDLPSGTSASFNYVPALLKAIWGLGS